MNNSSFEGVWQNRRLKLGYRDWCELIEMKEGSFYNKIKEFPTFQEMLDSMAKDGWQEKHFFLYIPKNVEYGQQTGVTI